MLILDNKRLGKQRVEARTALKVILEGYKSPLVHNPVCKMWMGYERALIKYYNISLDIWASRGFKNEVLQPLKLGSGRVKYPWWFGVEELHTSHKSRLLFKDYNFYSKYGWAGVPYNLAYWWPSQHLDYNTERRIGNGKWVAS